MFGQLSVSQGLPLADHSGGFRSHPAVMIDGASQVVIFNHLISTCSIAAGLIFSPVLELCVGAKYKHSSIVFDVATLLFSICALHYENAINQMRNDRKRSITHIDAHPGRLPFR
jgi:hypothetical protein